MAAAIAASFEEWLESYTTDAQSRRGQAVDQEGVAALRRRVQALAQAATRKLQQVHHKPQGSKRSPHRLWTMCVAACC